MNPEHKNLNRLMANICLLVTIFLFVSCNQSKKQKIYDTLSDKKGKEWYLKSFDGSPPHYVYKYFSDGHSEQYYINNRNNKLFLIPTIKKKPVKWSLKNDSIAELLYSESSMGTEMFQHKILYFSKDTIILQGYDNGNTHLFLLTHKK